MGECKGAQYEKAGSLTENGKHSQEKAEPLMTLTYTRIKLKEITIQIFLQVQEDRLGLADVFVISGSNMTDILTGYTLCTGFFLPISSF